MTSFEEVVRGVVYAQPSAIDFELRRAYQSGPLSPLRLSRAY